MITEEGILNAKKIDLFGFPGTNRHSSGFCLYFEYCGMNRNSDQTLMVLSMEIYAACMH